jgi:uncharacterized membrane protein YhaH (DUF805 family)
LILAQYLFFRVLISSGELPDPLAIHWGLSGEPDGFSNPSDFLRGITIAYLVILLLMAIVGFTLKRRLLGALLCGFLVFFLILLATIFSSSMLVQVGKRADEVSVSLWVWVLLILIPVGLIFALLTTPQVLLGEDLRVQLLGFTFLRLKFSELTGVSEIEIRARDYGGLGVRYANKTLAFIPRAGRGVLVTTSFGESLAIRSNSPELLIPAISARIEKP